MAGTDGCGAVRRGERALRGGGGWRRRGVRGVAAETECGTALFLTFDIATIKLRRLVPFRSSSYTPHSYTAATATSFFLSLLHDTQEAQQERRSGTKRQRSS